MKKMKEQLKRLFVLALVIAMTGSGLPLATLDVSASEVTAQEASTTETVPEDALDTGVQEEATVPEETGVAEEENIEETADVAQAPASDDETEAEAVKETEEESFITTVECDLSDYIVQEGGLETIEDASVGRNIAQSDIEGAKAALLEGMLNREAEVDIISYKISVDQIESIIAM